MFLFLCRLHKGIDNISENMQRSIYVTSLFQTISIDFRLFCPFTPCQINNIYFRSSSFSNIIHYNFRLNVQSKNSMGSRRLIIHCCCWSFPVLNSPHQDRHGIFIVGCILLRKPFYKYSFLEILTNLPEF